jgi:hypothetical protein
MQISTHAMVRIRERIDVPPDDVLAILTHIGYITLGEAWGQEYGLFYVPQKDGCFVALIDPSRNRLCTIWNETFRFPEGVRRPTNEDRAEARHMLFSGTSHTVVEESTDPSFFYSDEREALLYEGRVHIMTQTGGEETIELQGRFTFSEIDAPTYAVRALAPYLHMITEVVELLTRWLGGVYYTLEFSCGSGSLRTRTTHVLSHDELIRELKAASS